MTEYCLIINGKPQQSSSFFEKYNPASRDLLGLVPDSHQGDVDFAVQSSREGFLIWSRMTPTEREHEIMQAVSVLESDKTHLAKLLTLEQGKPLKDAFNEVDAAIFSLKRAAKHRVHDRLIGETAEYRIIEQFKPVGVVAAILPWNYPLFLCVDKIARSLAHLNSVIIKPSPHTPLTALRVGELLNKVLPPGVVNVITGSDIDKDKSVGSFLAKSPGIDKICFVGSTTTGKKILANCAETVKRSTMELGGNDPSIVLPDVDISACGEKLADAALTNNGQICVAPKRIYVHESIFDEFLTAMTEAIRKKHVGDGLQEGVDLGPINNEMQFEKLKEFYVDAINQGARAIHRGIRPANTNPEGLFLEPTIFVGMDITARIVTEEQFGPYIPLIPYRDIDDAISMANDSPYGLGASVFGTDIDLANKVADRLQAGTVWVNEHIGDLGDAPSGGMKFSGIGREGDWGDADRNAYTETKVVKYAK